MTETRLVQAAKQLKTEDKSIAEVCFSSGYSSLSNFNRMFKSTTAFPPSEYRNSGTSA